MSGVDPVLELRRFGGHFAAWDRMVVAWDRLELKISPWICIGPLHLVPLNRAAQSFYYADFLNMSCSGKQSFGDSGNSVGASLKLRGEYPHDVSPIGVPFVQTSAIFKDDVATLPGDPDTLVVICGPVLLGESAWSRLLRGQCCDRPSLVALMIERGPSQMKLNDQRLTCAGVRRKASTASDSASDEMRPAMFCITGGKD